MTIKNILTVSVLTLATSISVFADENFREDIANPELSLRQTMYSCYAQDAQGHRYYAKGPTQSGAMHDAMENCQEYSKVWQTCRPKTCVKFRE